MMKCRNKIHVSFDLVEEFIPRAPRQRCKNEDGVTERICVTPDILSALQAIPQAGIVIHNMKRLGIPVVIHVYYLTSESVLMPEDIKEKVPDAIATREMWILDKPQKVYRVDYELTNSYAPMKKDRNGTVERFLVFTDFKRTHNQDNWCNLAHRLSKSNESAKWFLENKPDISFRTFVSNLDEDMLQTWKTLLVEVDE